MQPDLSFLKNQIFLLAACSYCLLHSIVDLFACYVLLSLLILLSFAVDIKPLKALNFAPGLLDFAENNITNRDLLMVYILFFAKICLK